MHHLWKKVAAAAFLALAVLWLVGAIRALTLPYADLPALSLPTLERFSASLPTANNLKQVGLEQMPLPLLLDQGDLERIRVHEKSGQLALGTTAFDDDEAGLRSILTAQQAVIFKEKSSGLAPERRLTLEIGVHPEKFEALMDRLRTLGHLESVSVQQDDRTGEFRRLHAQRQSLKKHQEAVLKLRQAKKLSVDDALKLEQRLREIDKELQTLGAQLGDLLGRESFYRILVTLLEYQPGSRFDPTYTLPRRLGGAFVWGLGRWFVLALVAGSLTATWLSVKALWPVRTVTP